MDETKMAALLGRPLTSIETTNFSLYLKIARETLDDLLCMTLCDDGDSKTYDVREGYRTLFTDIFTEVTEVKKDGDIVDPSKYSVRQWDKRNGSWYNSIVFDTMFTGCDEEVEVTADWGFNSMPVDLQAVLAGLFGLITKKSSLDTSITSKQVEDFRIAFRTDVDIDTEFEDKYAKTINKYSICDIPNVQHGEVCSWNHC
jgi:hypothetical protein